MRITHELQCAVRNTYREIDQWVGNIDGVVVLVDTSGVVEAAERDLTAEREVIEPVELDIADIAA